ncbi:MAG: replication-associated recombination protein A [Bacteroidota bacterium]|nr:replication-associated recombination protein A [Bacteroidota bacterium]
MQGHAPLAERMRPKSLDEYVGQKHLVGEGAVLRRAMKAGTLPSMILWGPPGVGKTTLARLIAAESNRPFHALSAIHSGVKDVRAVIDSAKRDGMFAGRALLFIDEIHRFSKSQQDSLLGAVEAGTVTLIGATTENPSFEVIPALRSRCQTYVLESLSTEVLMGLVQRALNEDERMAQREVVVAEQEALLRASGGDARRLLNTLELVVDGLEPNDEGRLVVTNKAVTERVQNPHSNYDKGGEAHYDVISAFIKSIRASDPNAAVYYLARMVEGGEDPKFIARRLLIAASEDIGNANPTALVLANNTLQAVDRIGWPESRIVLAQCTVYLATSAKSNASYKAIGEAQAWVREHGEAPVPLALRNAPTGMMKDLGYGKGYAYDHDAQGGFSGQECMPPGMEGTTFYRPGNNPREEAALAWLKSRWGDKYGY